MDIPRGVSIWKFWLLPISNLFISNCADTDSRSDIYVIQQFIQRNGKYPSLNSLTVLHSNLIYLAKFNSIIFTGKNYYLK